MSVRAASRALRVYCTLFASVPTVRSGGDEICHCHELTCQVLTPTHTRRVVSVSTRGNKRRQPHGPKIPLVLVLITVTGDER